MDNKAKSLTERLRLGDVDARRSAARQLSKLTDPRTLPDLIGALSDADAGVRQFAIDALSQIGDSTAVPDLIRKLEDENSNVRREACLALSLFGDPRAREELTIALNDPEAEVRSAAADALGEIGDVTSIPSLVALALEDRDQGVRITAVSSLEGIGRPAIPALRSLALSGQNDRVHQWISKVLERLEKLG